MDIAKRLIAPIYIDENQIDIDAFVKHFILFDKYILESTQLFEIPQLIRTFSFNGFLDLVESGGLSISCFCQHPGMFESGISQGNSFQYKPGLLNKFSLVTVFHPDPSNQANIYIDKIIKDLNLQGRQIVQIRKTIYSVLINPEIRSDNFTEKSTLDEIINNPNILSETCSLSIKTNLGLSIEPSKIKIYPKRIDACEVEIDSNLTNGLKLSELNSQKTIVGGILSIAGRNDRINQMRQHSCLSGFSAEDIPFFSEKLSFLLDQINPQKKEQQFQKIIEIRGLPTISMKNTVSLNAKELINLRESKECQEFRQWLSITNEMSDKEIEEEAQNLTGHIGSFIHSDIGRSLRFFVINAIGFVPLVGQIASIGLSAVDEFLIEKIFPYSGPISFIDNLYPSIFKKNENT
jgi:hypothetical protein